MRTITTTSSPISSSSHSSSPSYTSTPTSTIATTTTTPFTPPPTYQHSSSFSSSSTIPFSWEQEPGIPKPTHHSTPKAPPPPSLPLPPPIRRKPTKYPDPSVPLFASDPFAAALAECSKPPDRSRTQPTKPTLTRRTRLGLGLGLGPLDLYGSCRSNRAVVDSTVCVPRPAQQHMLAYNLLHHRRRA